MDIQTPCSHGTRAPFYCLSAREQHTHICIHTHIDNNLHIFVYTYIYTRHPCNHGTIAPFYCLNVREHHVHIYIHIHIDTNFHMFVYTYETHRAARYSMHHGTCAPSHCLHIHAQHIRICKHTHTPTPCSHGTCVPSHTTMPSCACAIKYAIHEYERHSDGHAKMTLQVRAPTILSPHGRSDASP